MGKAALCALTAAAAAFFLPLASASACDCTGPKGCFLKVAPLGDIVIWAKVLAHHRDLKTRTIAPTAMRLKVLRVLKGKETRKEITVFGDRGADCLAYVSWFPVGSSWFFALHRKKPDRFDNRGGSGKHYAISVCGEFHARVVGKRVTQCTAGPRSARQSLPLTTFVNKLKARLGRGK